MSTMANHKHFVLFQEPQWWLLSEEQQLLLERVDPTELAAVEEKYAKSKSESIIAGALGGGSASAADKSSVKVTDARREPYCFLESRFASNFIVHSV